MNTVPENWIPFIPVHFKNDNREIQLQRASMPRIIEGDSENPKKTHPSTKLLRVGLAQERRAAYKLFEEEMLRFSVKVYQTLQRAPWHNGKVFIWLGIRKQTGRGEDSSGLRFDQIVQVKPKSSEEQMV